MHEDVRALLSAYLDRELTQAENQRVRVHLETCEACRREFADLQRLGDLAGSLHFVDPPEDRMNELERTVSVRAPRRAGWLLLIVGAAVWVGYAAYLFAVEPDVAVWQKLSLAAVVIGVVLLLLSAGRERWLEQRNDRYRRVIR